MSDSSSRDPRIDQAGASDESLLAAHEKLLGRKPDDGGHYKLLPLVLLFVFSGLIFFSAVYMDFYSGRYNSTIFNEHGQPSDGKAAPVKIDPLVMGKKNFELVCATCHQATGLGVPGVYPPLAGSEWVNDASPERVIHIVLYGLKGPLNVKGTVYNAAAMPVFGKVAGSGYNWSDDRIAATLTYVRQAFGNTAGAVTTEEVTAIRTKVGDRKEMTEEELLNFP